MATRNKDTRKSATGRARQSAARKPAAKPAAPKKRAASKQSAKQSAAKQSAAKQSAAKQSAAKQPAAKQSAKQPAAKQSAAKQSAKERAATKKSAATRTAAKKSAAKQPAAKQSAAKRNASAGAAGDATARHRQRGEALAERLRELQEEQLRRRSRREAKQSGGDDGASQLGQREYPQNPLPEQHLPKPGLESDLKPRPRYDAPAYRGASKLKDMVALITGADSGIGRAVAVLYAREGADIAIAYLSEHDDAEETRRAVEAEGRRAILIPGDVGDPSYAEYAVQRTVAELGRLDILVNNAAYQQHQRALEDITDEQLELTFRTNIFGYFYMARAALKQLGAGGVIVNSTSVTGTDGSGGLLDYAATKGAINAFTKSLAQNVLDRGIRVNAVAPGPVWTPLNPADLDADSVAEFGASVPMKRPAQPEELAPAYVFVASSVDSSYITGEIINVFGGKPTPG
jgi:NAD(P)-dependent dehydrogenase (short-subunit alcohol dehydrogenase family)